MEPHLITFNHVLLNETRWRAVLDIENLKYLFGLPLRLIHQDDLACTLREVFDGNYGLDDTDVYLVPDSQYDQALMLEVDFRYTTTQQVESLLRSGEVTIIPVAGNYQHWSTAGVVKDDGSRKLVELICPHSYHGGWNLRGGISIVIQDQEVTITANGVTSSALEREITPLLMQRYNVKVNTTGLRGEAEELLEQAVKNERRALYFEQLFNRCPGT